MSLYKFSPYTFNVVESNVILKVDSIMNTTNELPSWVNDFEVVTSEETEAKKDSEFEKLLDGHGEKNFSEGEVYKGQVIALMMTL
jgi:hypothetical protein